MGSGSEHKTWVLHPTIFFVPNSCLALNRGGIYLYLLGCCLVLTVSGFVEWSAESVEFSFLFELLRLSTKLKFINIILSLNITSYYKIYYLYKNYLLYICLNYSPKLLSLWSARFPFPASLHLELALELGLFELYAPSPRTKPKIWPSEWEILAIKIWFILVQLR